MSLYLRRMIEQRRAVHIAQMQAAETAKVARHSLPPTRARLDALRRWNAKRQTTARQATQEAGKKCRDTYWPWIGSLSEADRCRPWRMMELLTVFDANMQQVARHMRLMGWQRVHRRQGWFWIPPSVIS